MESSEDRFKIGGKRFVSVSKFKGITLVNVREYYESESGELKPGKKGISLKLDEWRSLVRQIDKVDTKIRELSGEDD